MAFEEFKGELDAPASGGGFAPFSGELDAPETPAARKPRGEIDYGNAQGFSASEIMDAPIKAGGMGSVLESRAADRPEDPMTLDQLRALEKRPVPRAGEQTAEPIKGKTIPINREGTFGRAGSLVGAQLDSYSAGLGYKLGDAAEAVGATGAAKDLKARGSALQGRADAKNLSISLSADGAFEKYAPQILAVFPTMAVAGMTGAVIPAMFGIAEVQAYAEGRKSGMEPGMALARAVPIAAAEAIGEKLGGTGKLIAALEKAVVKGGTLGSLKELSGRMLASGMREIPSEEATFAMQFGIDKAPGIGLKPNATVSDFLEGAKDTAIVAAGAGGMMAGGGMALSRLAARQKRFDETYPGAAEPAQPSALDPVVEIGKAQSVDEAIATAQAMVQSSAAVNNIAEILKQNQPQGLINSAPAATENVAGLNPDVAQTTQAITDLEAANVSPSAGIQPVAAGTPGSGMSEPGVSLEAPLGTERTAGPAMDAGRLPDQSDRGFIPLEPGTPLDAVDPRLIPLSQRQNALQNITEIIPATNVQDQTPAGPVAQGQAAPAQTPEAGARAGVQPAAAGTPAGDTAVQAAGVAPAQEIAASLNAAKAPKPTPANPAITGAATPAKAPDSPTSAQQSQLADESANNLDAAATPQPTARQIAIQAEKVKIEAMRENRRAAAQPEPKPMATALIPKSLRDSNPEHIGKDNTPLVEGGKPFKTNREAKLAQKQQPMMRVVKAGKGKTAGYALAPKTEKQIAAQEKAARRLGGGYTSPAGEAISAHSFIADKGGLAPEARADMGMDGNQRIGSSWLFAGQGKGLTIERATEYLVEEGYLPEGASHSQAMALIKRSLTQPQYTPEGTERMALAEAEANFADHLAAQEEAAQNEDPFESLAEDGFDPFDIETTGYDELSDPIKLEVNALLALAESKGIDTDSIKEQAYEDTRNGSEQDYYEAAKSALTQAIAESDGGGRQDSGAQGDAGSQAGVAPRDDTEGLTSPTPADVLAQQDRKDNADSLDQRQQIDREATGQTLTSQTAPEQRTDTSGDMFAAESDAATQSELGNLSRAQQAAGEEFADATPEVHRAEAERISKAAAGLTQLPDIKRRYEALAESHRLAADRKEQGDGMLFSRAAKATEVLDAADIKGKDRLEALRDVRAGLITPDELEAAYPAKVDQTETPAFKKWFGDWTDPKAFSSRAKGPVSAAVGDGNKPLVLYHATNRDFSEFKVGRPSVNSGTFGDIDTERHGIFTTPDIQFAEQYLKNADGQNVMPVYARIMSPMDMRGEISGEQIADIIDNSDGAITRRDFYGVKASETWQFFDGDFGKNFVAAAKKAGYDGAIIKEYSPGTDAEHDVYVAFEPTQLKSAIGNNGDFDPADARIQFSRAAKAEDTKDLVIQHNLTAENLLFADRMGGLAVPSLAITKADQPMQNFGEITLLGDRNMADPKQGIKAYGADIYSPRYPQISYQLERPALAKLNAALAPYRKEGDREIYGGEITRVDDLTSDKAFKAYADPKNRANWSEIKAKAVSLLQESGATERLFQGFTDSGNRRYKPHTLENVIAILKKELRGGENFNYGAGSLRAKFTPQFRSIEAIKKAKGSLVTKEQFEAIKDEVNNELVSIAEDMNKPTDTVIAIFEDAPRMGLKRAASQYDVDLGDAMTERMAEFLTRLRNMPTEYFEGKMLRSVGIGEFKAAVVPSGVKPAVISLLEREGVKVFTYKKGDESDRARVIKNAAVATPDAMFSRAPLEPVQTKNGATAFKTPEIALANPRLNVRQPGGAVTRIDFEIRDRAVYARAIKDGDTPAQAKEEATVGIITLDIDAAGVFKSLRNIEVFQSKRGSGIAEKVVGGIVESLPAGAALNIHDILPAATGFWDKMGAKFPRSEDTVVTANLTPEQFRSAYDSRTRTAGAQGQRQESRTAEYAGAGSGRSGADGAPVSGRPQGVRNPSTVERVQAAVAELIGGKQLPGQLGRVVITTSDAVAHALKMRGYMASVQSRMFRIAHYPEVFDSIIAMVPVDVVDKLAREKFSAKELLHDPAMLLDLSSGNGDHLVATRDAAASLVKAAADFAAENPSIFVSGQKGRTPVAVRATDKARENATSRKGPAAMNGSTSEAAETIGGGSDLVGGSGNAGSTLGTIDNRHVVTPTSDGVLGAGAASTVPAPPILRTLDDDVQAFYDPSGKMIYLLADRIPVGAETAVFAHELMHAHGQTVLGADGWTKLHDVINGWSNSPEDSDERAVYNYARSRVEAVGMELSSQEMFPYAVEAAIKMGVKPSLIAKQGTVARWLGSVKYAMQQAWGKVTGRPETFKTQDLVDLAFGIAQREHSLREEVVSLQDFNDGFNTRAELLSNAARRMAGMEQGLDGLDAAERSGLKLVTVLMGEDRADIPMFSRTATQTGTPAAFDDTLETDGWSMPEPTRADKVIYNLQDGRIDLKRVQEAIKAAGAEIAEKFDARQAETLYPGRVARRAETFLNIEVKPLLQDMALNKIDMAELGDYLIARHAPERNAQVAKVNPDMPDGGAGRNSQGVLMTDDAAAEYLAAIPAAKLAKLTTLARKVDAITAGTRALLVGEGLEKQETVDAWTKAYKNYVPLFKDEAEHAHPQGRGFTVKGSASKRSTGSTKEVTNVLAHVLMQRETAITRAEKNRVGLSLYGLALSNPNADFWTTIKPNMSTEQIMAELQAMGVDPLMAGVGMASAPTVRTVDPLTDKVVDRPNPMYKNLPGAITLRVNGEDRVLLLNQDNERALRMATNLKNLDGVTQLELAGSIIGKSTRWIASVNTQYNAAFGLVNVTRDTLGGIVNLTNTPLRKQKIKVLANVPAALKGIARDLRGDTRTEWSDLFNQFQDDGGQTGFKEMFRTADDRAKAIEKEITAAGKSGMAPGKMAHAVLDLLDDFNTALENSVRLSAYKAALDQGMSRPAAAKLARELTVDFNRKGRAGREISPLYAFFNASVQGTARTLETLAGPAGAKIIAGGLALGSLQALMLAFAGFDDDEPPEFIKSRALIIPIGGDKRYIAIPYQIGLHVIPNTGRVLTELTINGGKDIGKRTVEAVGEIAGAFNPMGGGNIFTTDGALKTLAPTLIDPLIELASNKNFAGTEIEKKPFHEEGDNRPGFQRARESTQRSATGQVYLGISKAINTMTGGNDFEAGMASPTPERVRYLAQTVGGGVLRELEKSINTSMSALNDDELTARGIPVVGRFYGEIDSDQSERSHYFESAKTIKKYETSRKAADKAGATDIADKLIQRHPELEMARTLNNVQERISKLNKKAAETINDREELKRIDEDRFAEMKGLNDELKKMERAKREPTIAERLRGEKD